MLEVFLFKGDIENQMIQNYLISQQKEPIAMSRRVETRLSCKTLARIEGLLHSRGT